MPRRCFVYVDGYNFYYGILRQHPEWKWLNLQSFFESLRPDEDVLRIKLFTAIIEADKRESERRDRMKRYLRALTAFSKVEVILGRYQPRLVMCRADCRKEYYVPEEKKTDVNIAVNLLSDCFFGKADSVILVSGDSDLEPAVHWARTNCPKIKITVYIPAAPCEQNCRRNDFYRQIGVTCRFLPLDSLKNHQLPKQLLIPDGSIVERPESWK